MSNVFLCCMKCRLGRCTSVLTMYRESLDVFSLKCHCKVICQTLNISVMFPNSLELDIFFTICGILFCSVPLLLVFFNGIWWWRLWARILAASRSNSNCGCLSTSKLSISRTDSNWGCVISPLSKSRTDTWAIIRYFKLVCFGKCTTAV